MATDNSLSELLANTVVDRTVPLRDQIYQIIRGAIVTGRVKPGDSIDEAQIARLLGISRTPVREAVKKISDESLIHVRAQSGTHVAAISRRQVEEAYIIRTALELESVVRASSLITPADINELEKTVTALRELLKLLLVERAIDSPSALPGLQQLARSALRGKDAARADVQKIIEESRALLDTIKTEVE